MSQPLSRQQQHRQLGGRKGSSMISSSVIDYWLQKPPLLLPWTAMAIVILSSLWYISQDFTTQYYQTLNVGYLKGSSSSSSSGLFDATINAQRIQAWRSETEDACRRNMIMSTTNDNILAQKEQVEREAMNKLQFPNADDISTTLPSDHQQYQYCRNVFIDLGTNIGDSIGYFVDNALDVCSPIWMEKYPRTKLTADFPRPHLDVTTLNIVHKGAGNNPLYGLLQSQMRQSDPPLRPEHFCVYGMEGNPEFTPRLQKLENYVMQTQPRPVQHLHIHTESVVTAVDGPTKLYLDKTSVEQNFWGSSILSSQQDAVKSAEELGSGQVFSADVQGISLSTLTKNTALAFKPDATTEETKGGLLIIKMDVEGAEYQVLKEVAASGVLCEYIQRGNRVVMIVEYHNMSITDPIERRREKTGANDAQTKLASCGVEFGKLHASWH